MENKNLEAEHGILCRLEGNRFGYFGWPTIAKLNNDVLVAGCSGFRLAHFCPFGKSTLFYSFDMGKTWSPPVIVNDTPLDDRDVGLLPLGENRLLMTWFKTPTKLFQDPREQEEMKELMAHHEYLMSMAVIDTYTDEMNSLEAGFFTRLSSDGGITWEKPVPSPVSSPHGPCLLSDGSILYFGKGPHKDHGYAIQAWRSYDKGLKWNYSGIMPLPINSHWDNFSEPHAIQLPSGRIIAHVRYGNQKVKTDYLPFTIFQTVSDDEGQTWSVPYPLGVSGSPPHIIMHSSGALICVYGRREDPFGQHAMISYDGGKSWSKDWILRSDGVDGDLGYPSSVELTNGDLLTIYYQKYNVGEKTSILWSKWKLPQKDTSIFNL